MVHESFTTVRRKHKKAAEETAQTSSIEEADGNVAEDTAKDGPEETEDNATSLEPEKPEGAIRKLKYYFNRFRYYHYYCVETFEAYLTVFCLWIIRLFFHLPDMEAQAIQ